MKKDDIKPGSHFGYWTVLEVDDSEHPGKVLCRCICGREKWLFRSPLRCGKTKSCGCQAHKQSDFGLHPGDRVGYWTILKQRKDYFLCRCVCGREKWIYAHNLVKGLSLSCGCKRTDGDSQALIDGREIQAEAAKKHVLLKYAGFGRKSNKNNTSGVTGVALTRTGKYRAYISTGKRQTHLGVFATLEDARTARKAAEQRYFTDRQKKADAILRKKKKINAKSVIIGQRYGSWTVIALDDGQHPKRTLCRCDCGTERWVVNSTLWTGKSRSCGCKSYKEPPVYPIKAGDRIGHWTLLEQRRTKFLCQCDCGAERLISAYNLMHGKALECKNCAAKNIQEVMAKGNRILRPLQGQGLAPRYAGFGRKAKKLPRSGITGVYIQKGRYRAEITVDRKRIFLGSFETLKEAAAARHAAEVKYFGPRQKLADEIKNELKKDSSK